MTDPVIWYTINAQLDGLDTESTSPPDRMKFLVYQRRMLLAALRDKAMMTAAIAGGGEQAQKIMKQYLELQVPSDPNDKKLREYQMERQLDEFDRTGPIPITSFTFGQAVGPDELPNGNV